MEDLEQAVVDWYLASYPAHRQELGLGFGGFPRLGPGADEGIAAAGQALLGRVHVLAGGRRALAARLVRRGIERANRGSDPSRAPEEVLGALVQAELWDGEARGEILGGIPQQLRLPAGSAQSWPAPLLDYASHAAALAAGILLSRGTKVEEAEQGAPDAVAFMALEGYVRAIDGLRPADEGEGEGTLGADALLERIEAEFGVRPNLREIGDDTFTALRADLREMQRLAREIAPGKSLEAIFEELGEDAPETEEELLAAYEEALLEVREALEEDFPGSAAPLAVALVPAQLHGLLPVTAYQPPPLTGGGGRMLITPPRGPMRAAHARGRLPLAAAHDGWPGSHLLFAAAGEGRALDRLCLTPYAAQGWAHYAAQYAAERSERPKVRLFAALDAAQRAGRAFLDVAVHAGLAPREEVVRTVSEALMLPAELAEAELRACLHQPLYGFSAWWLAGEIRRFVQALRASGQSASSAHAKLLAAGGVPEREGE